jgi:hypothetical protein
MEDGSPLKPGEELGKGQENRGYRLNNYNRGQYLPSSVSVNSTSTRTRRVSGKT